MPSPPSSNVRLGLNASVSFTGSLAFPYLYPWPQRPQGLIEAAFAELGKRWTPILNAYESKKDQELGKTIFNRVLAMLINEAADTLYLNIASREDIDLAMTKGVNYPKGLLKWADEIGIDTVTNTLQQLYDEYGEDRYRPSVLLKRMSQAKKHFY